MIFAGSEAYLDALRPDLGEAGRILGSRFVVISAGAQVKAEVAEHQVPCDARFQSELGGARQSLNVRILLHLLEHGLGVDLNVDTAMEILGNMSHNLDPLEKFDRKTMTDEEIITFVRRELSAQPGLKHSPLLRKLRDSGFRCEQSRFKKLFLAEVTRHGG